MLDDDSTDVLIVGAGPVGLCLANFLGLYGVRAVVLERLEGIIDYPRGVGMDDECLRSFQAFGLADAVLPHTTPDHWMRFTTGSGRVFASIEPRTDEFGWPRRNAFLQPLADAVLLAGVRRFPGVSVRFGSELLGFSAGPDGVAAEVAGPGGTRVIRARYLVGCDGGRSAVRKALGVAFEGKTESTRWLVVDVEDDPIGRPNAYLVGDPARPTVSIALPHGVRRLEFLVFAHETDEAITAPAALHGLLARVVDRPELVRIIRQRVYTHHARLAARFRAGPVLLAGDAAHLMPVWQGQGYNSGIRDATNLGWKLASVLRGQGGDGLLDTYEQERREHAAAMIGLSVMAGRIFSPTNRWAAGLRDAATRVMTLVPPMQRYVTQMRFKPMPRYTQGAVVPGRRKDAVGRMFPQPMVSRPGAAPARLDDALGPWWAVLSWGGDPRSYMDEAALRTWRALGGRFVCLVPGTQLDEAARRRPGLTVLGDAQGRLKEWFGRQDASVVFLRPDRFVAAMCGPQVVSETTASLAGAISFTLTERTSVHADPASMLVA